jgi:hypothetical protein
MSSGLMHWTEKRKWRPEEYVEVAHQVQGKDKDEQSNTAKEREAEGRHVGGKVPREDDCMVCSTTKGEASSWLPLLRTYDMIRHPKASYPSFRIDIRTLCTPETRSLSTWEIDKLAILQSKVDKATAGTWLRILANVPRSIQLTA